MSKVSYERVGAAAVLTIDAPRAPQRNRPRHRDPAARRLHELRRRRRSPGDGPTGDEQAFCAGADLKSMAQAGTDPEIAKQWLEAFPDGPLGFTRLTSPKPTIAAISGYALAGGLELALWCDLRVGTETAKLGFPERRWGVPLIDGGTQRLPRIVGLGRGLDLILSGRIVEADEAHADGPADRGGGAGQASGAGPGDGRGPGRLPPGDDARRPPRRDRGIRPPAGGRRSPWRPRSAARSRAPGSPAPPASPRARAAAEPAPASDRRRSEAAPPKRASRCGTRAAGASRSRPRPRRSPRRGPPTGCLGSWWRGGRRPGRCRRSCSSRSRS